MFENIIGQTKVITTLREDVRRAALPRAMLFYGPAFTAKMTTALELARVISCDAGKGEWQCDCAACEQHRLLASPNLLLLGPHYFELEIAAAGDTLLRTRKVSSGYLFMRAVRKLIKRFDPVFAKSEEGNLQKANTLIEEIEDKLQLLAPERELAAAVDVEKLIAEIGKQCQKLSGLLKSDNIPIDQVRKINYWAHFSHAGKKKIIIMENIDKMHEASRNALLKLLEEPPLDVHLILLSVQKGAIIKTVLSRLRPYYFQQRSTQEEMSVLAKIFGETAAEKGAFKYDSLYKYFLAWKNVNPADLRALAAQFLELVLRKARSDELAGLDILWGEVEAGEAIRYFAQELLGLLHGLALAGRTGGAPAAGNGLEAPLPLRILERWSAILHEHLGILEGLNMDPQLTLESIFYKFKEAAE